MVSVSKAKREGTGSRKKRHIHNTSLLTIQSKELFSAIECNSQHILRYKNENKCIQATQNSRKEEYQ